MANEESTKAERQLRPIRSSIEIYGAGQQGRRMIGVLFTDWTPEEAYAALAAAYADHVLAGEKV